MKFFSDGLLLGGKAAERLYAAVKDLPIIDYHCHLDERKIAENAGFANIGELWLGGDHYKWRAMRLMGVDEYFITGGADWHEKFLHYAEVVPSLAGNPLYYWTHLELRQVFGIDEPLNKESAERIWTQANEKLKSVRVRDLLQQYRVEFIATTDDPVSPLAFHGTYGGTKVCPTFRPDKIFTYNRAYLDRLEASAGVNISTLDDLLAALTQRLDYFALKGCVISDHGFENFPARYSGLDEARAAFLKGEGASAEEKDGLFGFLLLWLASAYAQRNITMQLHFGAARNVNPECFKVHGVDSGFDIPSAPVDTPAVLGFLSRLVAAQQPDIVLYPLNDSQLPALCALTGAFRRVKMGAAWWFNDTVEGIRRNLKTVAEYAALGASLGMLTDSRSFSSYSRFDFFRRILCGYIGELVERGEYDEGAAKELVRKICYDNAKALTREVKI